MAHRAPLIIADYSDDWPRQFAAERNRLLAALPTGFEVEHVGSTAVPDLAAKPIIDLMQNVWPTGATPETAAQVS